MNRALLQISGVLAVSLATTTCSVSAYLEFKALAVYRNLNYQRQRECKDDYRLLGAPHASVARRWIPLSYQSLQPKTQALYAKNFEFSCVHRVVRESIGKLSNSWLLDLTRKSFHEESVLQNNESKTLVGPKLTLFKSTRSSASFRNCLWRRYGRSRTSSACVALSVKQ